MKNLIIRQYLTLISFFVTYVILLICLDSNVEASKEKTKEPKVFQDDGIFLKEESRTYSLNVEKNSVVSFVATGSAEKGNIDCAAYTEKSVLMLMDNDKKNSCSIKFSPISSGKYHFIVRNNSDENQRFAASVIY